MILCPVIDKSDIMTLLQCYEKLHNHVIRNGDDRPYSQDPIDMNEIWKVILSSAEVSLSPLNGISSLLTLYGSSDTVYQSISDAVTNFSDSSVSIKERFKSAQGLIAFMSYFDEKSVISVIKSFITMMNELTKKPDTIPFKLLADFAAFGQLSMDALYYIFTHASSCSREEKPSYALLLSVIYSHYTEMCDEESEPSLEEFYDLCDDLILSLIKGTNIEKACACYFAETIYLMEDDDSSFIIEELFQPCIDLATCDDKNLSKRGHSLLNEMFRHRVFIDVDHVYQFLGVKDRYKNKHYFFKELRYLFIPDEDMEDEDDQETKITEVANKKIIKFLNKVISNPASSDEEVSEALGSLNDCGIDIDAVFNEEQLDIAIKLLVKEPSSIWYPSLSNFFVNFAGFPNKRVNDAIIKLFPRFIEIAKKTNDSKISGMIGVSLSGIVLHDTFESKRKDVFELILFLFKSACADNIEYAARMILFLKDVLDESTVAPIYSAAIAAAEVCEDIDITNFLFKALKKMVKYFAVDEEISKAFIPKIIKGDIACMANIPLMYGCDDNLPMFKYIASVITRFKSQATALATTFVDMLLLSIDEMKCCALIPISAILSHGVCTLDQSRKIARICFYVFDQFGSTFEDTISQAANAISYIRKQFPEVVEKERIVKCMKEVISTLTNDSEYEEEEEEEEDIGDFDVSPYFTRILIDILHEDVDEDDDAVTLMRRMINVMPFDKKYNIMDELCGQMAALVKKNPESPIARDICKYMLSTVLKPQSSEMLNISEKTRNTMIAVLKKRASEDEDFEVEMVSESGLPHGIKRKIRNILKH